MYRLEKYIKIRELIQQIATKIAKHLVLKTSCSYSYGSIVKQEIIGTAVYTAHEYSGGLRYRYWPSGMGGRSDVRKRKFYWNSPIDPYHAMHYPAAVFERYEVIKVWAVLTTRLILMCLRHQDPQTCWYRRITNISNMIWLAADMALYLPVFIQRKPWCFNKTIIPHLISLFETFG